MFILILTLTLILIFIFILMLYLYLFSYIYLPCTHTHKLALLIFSYSCAYSNSNSYSYSWYTHIPIYLWCIYKLLIHYIIHQLNLSQCLIALIACLLVFRKINYPRKGHRVAQYTVQYASTHFIYYLLLWLLCSIIIWLIDIPYDQNHQLSPPSNPDHRN